MDCAHFTAAFKQSLPEQVVQSFGEWMVATKKRKNVFGRLGRNNNLDKTFVGASNNNNNGTSSFDFSLETVETLPPAATTIETTPLAQERNIIVTRNDDEYRRALTKTVLTVSAAGETSCFV